jgi:hypothetical protein
MRVNVYAEEMTERIEIISKEIDGQTFTGLRFYLELPVTIGQYTGGDGYLPTIKGPFVHRPGDDDSSAVTFWGKQDLRSVLKKALEMLDQHYSASRNDSDSNSDVALCSCGHPASVHIKSGLRDANSTGSILRR